MSPFLLQETVTVFEPSIQGTPVPVVVFELLSLSSIPILLYFALRGWEIAAAFMLCQMDPCWFLLIGGARRSLGVGGREGTYSFFCLLSTCGF